MLPLRDVNPVERQPHLTWALIAVCVAVFVMQSLAADGQTLVLRFGVVPSILTDPAVLVPNGQGGAMGALVTPFTSMFMHGSLMHLIGNVWFLWVFGDNVEDALGRGRFLVFYLATGFAAGLVQVLVNPSSDLPMVGASGAISGVLAGYFVLFPHARVITWVFFSILEVPAVLFIFVWFAMQLASGLTSLGLPGDAGGVAWWAHVGGFVTGLVMVRLMAPRRPRRQVVHRRRDGDEEWL